LTQSEAEFLGAGWVPIRVLAKLAADPLLDQADSRPPNTQLKNSKLSPKRLSWEKKSMAVEL